MKLGIGTTLPHTSPEEWAEKHCALGLKAVVFPCSYTEKTELIDAYVSAAKAAGLCIAEVGAWSNPISPDSIKRAEATAHCIHSLELAEYVGARCCVNISGAMGEIWDGSYPENYSGKTYELLIETIRKIIDEVKPVRTKYALESMPNMHPDSPEDYLQILNDIDREGFGVHLDLVNMLVSPRVFCDHRSLIDRSFKLLGPYMRSCHLKDAVLDSKLTVSIRETECGTGGIDLGYYISGADSVSTDMPMILEHLPSLEAYYRSIDTIRNLLP